MAPLTEPPTSAMTRAPVWTRPDPSPITRCREGAVPPRMPRAGGGRGERRDALPAGVCTQQTVPPLGGLVRAGLSGHRWEVAERPVGPGPAPSSLAGPCGQPSPVAGGVAGGPGDPGLSPFAGSLCVWRFLEQRTGHAGDGILELKPKTWAAEALPAGLPARPPQGGALIKATCDRWGRPHRGPDGSAVARPARLGVGPDRAAEAPRGSRAHSLSPGRGPVLLPHSRPWTLLPFLRLCLRPEGGEGQSVPGSS